MKEKIKQNKLLYMGVILLIIFEILIYIIEPYIKDNIKLITKIAIIAVSFIYLIYINKKKIYNLNSITVLIFIIGVLIRTMYCVYTTVDLRQHDALGSAGHLSYTYTIYKTGHLPQTNDWQFYHPPLSHLIGAGWLKINNLVGIPLDMSFEGLQVLSVLYSSISLIIIYCITNKLKIKDKYKLMLNTFVTFYPQFIILSGWINNDSLLTMLEFLVILYLIKWNEETNWKNTVILALFTGLSVMTKLNGAIMAIPILYIFIKKLIYVIKEHQTEIKNMLYKFTVFGCVSLPIGLWYYIRNYILFRRPLGYVPNPGEFLYVGDYSFIKRFLSLSVKELFGEISCFVEKDINIPAYIIKSSVFGEYLLEKITIVEVLLLLFNFFLIIFSIIMIIKYFIKNKNKTIVNNILFIILFVNIITYIYFNIKLPFRCSMDFRYLIPTIYPLAVGLFLGLQKCSNKLFVKVVELSLLCFIILSFTWSFMYSTL